MSSSLIKTSKFCSKNCSSKANKGRSSKVELTCIYCGDNFKVYPSQLKYGNPQYCSHDCCYKHRKEAGLFKGKIIIRKCDYCGKELELTPSQVTKTNFCNQQCHGKYKETLLGEDNPNYDPDKHTTMVCEWCGEEFDIHICKLKERPEDPGRNDGRFCSRQCLGAWTSRYAQNRVSQLEIDFTKELEDAGLVFETQYPIKGFSIDVAFPKKKVAVEIDGDYWHSLPRVIEKDKRKDKRLKNQGWKVVHVKECTIRNELEKAIEQVKNATLEPAII